MKKTILFLFLITIILSACEKDDFCAKNPITPNLVLRFYDNANTSTFKNVERLSIWAEGKDTITEYNSVNTDSVSIPLNSLASQTIYHLKMNNIDGNLANNQTTTFTINYTTEEEYISRSCGYRVIFNNVSFTHNNTWVQSITPTTLTSINNQNEAHVQIFH